MKFRIPSWARNIPMPGKLYHYVADVEGTPSISLNGEVLDTGMPDGYFTVTRAWEKGDRVELNFDMPVRMVRADEQVADDRGKASLERGPLIYAIEEIDNKTDFDDITLSPEDDFTVTMESDLLGGVITISTGKLSAIPYYTWSNRGVGKMKVWINLDLDGPGIENKKNE